MLLMTISFSAGLLVGIVVFYVYTSSVAQGGKRKRKTKRLIQRGDQVIVSILGCHEDGVIDQVDYERRMALARYGSHIAFAQPIWLPLKNILPVTKP